MVFSQKSGSSTSSWRGKSNSQSTSTQSTPKKQKQKSNSQPQKTDESSYVPVTDKQKASSVFEPLSLMTLKLFMSVQNLLKLLRVEKPPQNQKSLMKNLVNCQTPNYPIYLHPCMPRGKLVNIPKPPLNQKIVQINLKRPHLTTANTTRMKSRNFRICRLHYTPLILLKRPKPQLDH